MRKGAFLAGVGAAYGSGASFPLSGLGGDLWSLGRVDLAYGVADGVVLEIRGIATRRLEIDRRGASAVPLSPDVADGRTSDVGDFSFGTLARLVGGPEGLAAGLHVEAVLPNSHQDSGIGTNTTNFRGSAFFSFGRGPWRATGDAGVAILQDPLDANNQNDVLAYAGELWYRGRGERGLGAFVGLEGRASTRGIVPLGTESLGRLRTGARYRAGPWEADLDVGVGYTEPTPDWELRLGAALITRL